MKNKFLDFKTDTDRIGHNKQRITVKEKKKPNTAILKYVTQRTIKPSGEN